ncbi:MAG: MMPL family transporter [Pseudomonadota bacterium]
MARSLTPIAAFARRHALALWFLCIALATVVTVRTNYVADLSAFLPSTPSAEQAVLLDQLKSGVAARLVLMGIEGGTAEQRSNASLQFGQLLRKSGEFDAVHNGDNSGFEATAKFLFEHRYLLSPAVDAQRFTASGLRDGIDEATSLLGTPAGVAIKSVILRDPTGETIRMAESMLPSQAPRSDGRVWISRSAARAVLIATTHADGADLDAQERTLRFIDTRFAPFKAQGLTLIVSGSGTFAVASRTQIKSEVERLAIAGGVAIVGLMLLAFGGSLRTLVTAMLPVASGVLVGIAAVSLIFGNVHGITLGFGTTLIGEAVDYAIYYLIQARPAALVTPSAATGSGARRWIADNWPTVRLGLLTSVCGFAALLFSGFPGLAQLGVFSIAGLSAAALTTRWVLTRTSPNGAPGMGLRRHLGHFVGWGTRVLPNLRGPLAAIALLAALTLAWLPSAWRGDLASLSPVGAVRMKVDADLRADLGATDAGTLVAVSAADEAGVLAAAEAAGARLDRLVEAGAIGGYESPARMLPSPATQQARQAALPDAATLSARLREATVDGPLPAARLGEFITNVQAARQQTLLTRESLKGTPLYAALDALLVPGHDGRPWRALLSLQAGPKAIDPVQLRAALADLPGVQVVNIGAELGTLYARYLHEAGLQALLGAFAVCVLLALHLRSFARLWRIAQPVAAAVLIVLAVFSVSGTALGILHLVGLLLTVAIGSNYALFFDQIRAQQDAAPAGAPLRSNDKALALDNDTLASLALANLTAVISFLLLAFSSIPALFAIGQVVAPGILLSLVLSAAFIPARQR